MMSSTEGLKEIIPRVFQNIQEKNKNLDIFEIWEKAVGKRIAQHTKPVSFKRGILTINVDKVSWLFELNIFRPFILQRLKRFMEGENLENLRFRLGKV